MPRDEFSSGKNYVEQRGLPMRPEPYLLVVTSIGDPRIFGNDKEFCSIDAIVEEVPDAHVEQGGTDRLSFSWDPKTGDFTQDFQGIGLWKGFLRAIGIDPDITETVKRSDIVGRCLMAYKEMTPKGKGPFLRKVHAVEDPKLKEEAADYLKERAGDAPFS